MLRFLTHMQIKISAESVHTRHIKLYQKNPSVLKRYYIWTLNRIFNFSNTITIDMKTFIAAFSLMLFCLTAPAQTRYNAPATPAIPVMDTLHGVILTDEYRWLEDKTDPKVIEWTKAQHDYGIQYLDKTQKIHPGLREDIANYIDLDYEGPLGKEGNRQFQTIKRKGEKQNKLYTLLNGKKC